MSTDLATRLRQIMRTKAWSQADLARAARASRQSVSRWLADGRITIAPQFAFRLQDATGFSARWILLGAGPSDVLAEAERIIRQHSSRVRDNGKK